MKFKPLIGDQMSGSMGGVVASHNRGGTYFRQRAIPTNPGSIYQSAVRGFLSQLTSLWYTTLTAAQRTAWEAYAENVPFLDRLGEPRNIGGLGAYVSSNVPRLQAALPRVDDGPVIYNRGDFTAPAIASITAPSALSLTFETGDDWVGEDDAALLVYCSPGKNASINYYKGPYRFADTVLGDSVSPPSSPAAITIPFVLAADQKGFIQVRVSRADGRLSSPFRAVGVAV
jgi:hypothetical protein